MTPGKAVAIALGVWLLASCEVGAQATVFSEQWRPIAWPGTEHFRPSSGHSAQPMRAKFMWSDSGHLYYAEIQQFISGAWVPAQWSSDWIPKDNFFYQKVRDKYCLGSIAEHNALDFQYSMGQIHLYYPNGRGGTVDFGGLGITNKWGCKFLQVDCNSYECEGPEVDWEEYLPEGFENHSATDFWGDSSSAAEPSLTYQEEPYSNPYQNPAGENPQPDGYAVANWPGAGGGTVIVTPAVGRQIRNYYQGVPVAESGVSSPEWPKAYSQTFHWVRVVYVMQAGVVVGQMTQIWTGSSWSNNVRDEFIVASELTLPKTQWVPVGSMPSVNQTISIQTGGKDETFIVGGDNWAEEIRNDFNDPLTGGDFELPEQDPLNAQEMSNAVSNGIAGAQSVIYGAVGNAVGEVADAQTDSLKGETGVGDGKSLKDVVDAIDGLGGGGGYDGPTAEQIGEAVSDAFGDSLSGFEGENVDYQDDGFGDAVNGATQTMGTRIASALGTSSLPGDSSYQDLGLQIELPIPGGPYTYDLQLVPVPGTPVGDAMNTFRLLLRSVMIVTITWVTLLGLVRAFKELS